MSKISDPNIHQLGRALQCEERTMQNASIYRTQFNNACCTPNCKCHLLVYTAICHVAVIPNEGSTLPATPVWSVMRAIHVLAGSVCTRDGVISITR